jgi:8-oxo-dGTP pyrophosphatase MutT (NUDIX family)
MDLPGIDLSDYPLLAAPFHWPWGPIDGQFKLLANEVDDAKVANVRIVSFVGDKVVLAHMDYRHWNHPGGTREPDEAIMDTARRELMEEAGAELLSFHPFGAFEAHSLAAEPYRPHLPHPDHVGLVGYGDVVVSGQPTNPPGGETVVEVRQVDLAEAGRLLIADESVFGEMWFQVLELAVKIRNEG